MTEKNTRYLKQVIVADRSLSMPSGKLAAMVAHAAMTFLVYKLSRFGKGIGWASPGRFDFNLDEEEARWLTELDPGLEDQVSMAKIVCQVGSQAELLGLEQQARDAGLEVHRVVDCGYSHNPKGTLACICIGPDWPERLEPVTGGLKVYR